MTSTQFSSNLDQVARGVSKSLIRVSERSPVSQSWMYSHSVGNGFILLSSLVFLVTL